MSGATQTPDPANALQLTLGEVASAFRAAQEQRSAAYHDFDRGLKRYLQEGDTEEYQRLCAAVTASFAGLSQEINLLERELRSWQQHAAAQLFADALRAIQLFEKDKLQLTVFLHMLQCEDMLEAKHHSQHTHHDHDHDDTLEERRAQRQNNIRKMRAELAYLVVSINEQLSDIRYIVAEYEDDDCDDSDQDRDSGDSDSSVPSAAASARPSATS